MKVKELISKLLEFDADTEVLITDGMRCYCYRGDYHIKPYIDDKLYVDIGIGNCLEDDD